MTQHHRCKGLLLAIALMMPLLVWAQAPGTAPVSISHETQMLHGRKYYVHLVEKGQTVYSISKAYKVQSYDAVTHVDIHFLHPGDTVWLPCRGQFSEPAEALAEEKEKAAPKPAEKPKAEPKSEPKAEPATPATPPKVRPTSSTLRVTVMMPLYLNQIDEISTSKFDVEQKGKKSYKQFEFIEFYEGILIAMDQLTDAGIGVTLNVVDVVDDSQEALEKAFSSHSIGKSDVVIALLLRDAFSRAAAIAQREGVYIVNPMSTRSEIVATNPYTIKAQPSMAGYVKAILASIRAEHPSSQLYIIHSGSKAEKPVFDELKRQLTAQTDIQYTLFNWSQNARLVASLRQTPSACVLSIYDQERDQNRLYTSNLLNKLASLKTATPTLYTLTDWTRDYPDVDFAQLQQLSYHTFCTSWDMTNPVHVDFLKAFRTRFGTEPTTPLAASGHDIMLYLCTGLHRKGTAMWENAIAPLPDLIMPMHLVRTMAGLENDNAQLYRLSELRFVPASLQ